MTQPVIHDYLTQIFVKHYKMGPTKAAEEGLRFMEILQLYDLQIIKGDWVIPEVVELDPFQMLERITQETMEREPWLAREIQ